MHLDNCYKLIKAFNSILNFLELKIHYQNKSKKEINLNNWNYIKKLENVWKK